MYQVVAGIEVDPQAPGYKHIFIQPQPGGDLTRARASHNSLYGKVTSAWEMKDDRFELTVEIPSNTRATVHLPGAALDKVTEGGKPLAPGTGIASVRQEGDSVVVEIGSGRYVFAYARRVR
jgi:alpha-L-rhamnosidase